MKISIIAKLVGATFGAAALLPSTSFADCNAGSFFTGGCDDRINQIINGIGSTTVSEFDSAGNIINDAVAQGIGYANAQEASALVKTSGFLSASAASVAGFGTKVQLQAMITATQAAGFANAQAAYTRGYTTAAVVQAMNTYAKASGWASLAAADSITLAHGYANLAIVEANGYTSAATVELYSVAAHAAHYATLAAADTESQALGFTSYAARIVNDSKDFTLSEFNTISSTLQQTYQKGIGDAYAAYGYVLTAESYLSDASNLLSLLEQQCAQNANSTYKLLGGPIQTVATNMVKLAQVPTSSNQKAVPALQLTPVPPFVALPPLNPVAFMKLDMASFRHGNWSFAKSAAPTPNPSINDLPTLLAMFYLNGNKSAGGHVPFAFTPTQTNLINNYLTAQNNYYSAINSNTAAQKSFTSNLINYAPVTTGSNAQQALARLIRSIGRGQPIDKQMSADLALVAQTAGVIDAYGKNLLSNQTGAQHIGLYLALGATASGAGAGGALSFGIDTTDRNGQSYTALGFMRDYGRVPYAVTVGGGVQVTTDKTAQAGVSAGVFWGSGSIQDSEGINLSLSFAQQPEGYAFVEEGMSWTMPTNIAAMIKDAKDQNIIALGKDAVNAAQNLFTAACSAPDVNGGGGAGKYADEASAAANLQLGYQHIINKGELAH